VVGWVAARLVSLWEKAEGVEEGNFLVKRTNYFCGPSCRWFFSGTDDLHDQKLKSKGPRGEGTGKEERSFN